MTHDEIINAWNKQADYMNKWDRLGEDEKLEWAMKLEREACAKMVAGLSKGEHMTVPLNTDTRETYVNGQAAEHLHWAEVHHRLGHQRSMWLALFYYAMTEDLYGTHWDKLNER